MQQIQSRILKTAEINWKHLVFIQDDNFKEWIDDGDQKLVNSLLKYQSLTRSKSGNTKAKSIVLTENTERSIFKS